MPNIVCHCGRPFRTELAAAAAAAIAGRLLLPLLCLQSRRYRYTGKHWLGPMVAFIAKALVSMHSSCTPRLQSIDPDWGGAVS